MEFELRMIGNSGAMRDLRETVARVARTELPILICGESGSGKQLVAEEIHAHSQRAKGPFVTVDCGAIVSTLIETEIFGNVKGAFTGAATDRPGLLEAAAGGTVFLDEIGELPRELQTRFSRATECHEIRRVGATHNVKLDVRFLAATNRRLDTDVRAGKFRADLYYRLGSVIIDVPPLRDRREDIKLIAEHLLARLGTGAWVLSDTLLRFMEKYTWPGNVRELKNCIECMAALSPGPVLDTQDIPRDILVRHAQLWEQAVAHELRGSLEEMEAAAIARAVEASNGNRACAARLLGIGKSTLYRKLKKLKGPA